MAKQIDTISKSGQPQVSLGRIWSDKPVSTLKPLRLSSSHQNKISITAFVISLLIVGIVFLGSIVSDLIGLKKIALPGRYLVLFLNNAELRRSGGFIGSFMTLNFDGRRVTDYFFESNIYKKDNEFLKTNFIPVPEPLGQVWPGSFMAMASSNWPADFPESANQVEWYFEQEYNQTVDGIIAIDTTVLARLLGLTGPIDLPNHNLVLREDNFLSVLHQRIQEDYFDDPVNLEVNEPKIIIRDLLPVFLGRVARIPRWQLYQLAKEMLATRHIMISLNDQARQKVALQQDWAGEIKQTVTDFLMIVHANLGGGKSSLVVNESIELTLEGLQRRLKIIRTHPGANDPFANGTNQNWTTVLIPEQAVVQGLTLDGKDISHELALEQESGRQSIGFWFSTESGRSKVAELVYRVPETIDQSKKLLIQKQPGVLGSNLLVRRDSRALIDRFVQEDKLITW